MHPPAARGGVVLALDGPADGWSTSDWQARSRTSPDRRRTSTLVSGDSRHGDYRRSRVRATSRSSDVGLDGDEPTPPRPWGLPPRGLGGTVPAGVGSNRSRIRRQTGRVLLIGRSARSEETEPTRRSPQIFKSTCPSKSGGYGEKNDKWNDCDDKWGGYGGKKDKYEECDDTYSKYDDCDDKYSKYDDCWDDKYGKCDDYDKDYDKYGCHENKWDHAYS
ncbi:hypothetical protein PSU4_32560 [Pseudonocardia sulfidoxydans NBRC 16205]|uniref:Uncharacterized protein n=2 Tax=Pseudonocardia sulfidoxydans TaxID=54011 RepID=A0A511DHN1_9PSEU|nr:hypothetical protein PSU4_32560 [Pseudonocardia sulfidoxydans NBRC 16205]